MPLSWGKLVRWRLRPGIHHVETAPCGDVGALLRFEVAKLWRGIEHRGARRRGLLKYQQ
jgi:hypothetical protein